MKEELIKSINENLKFAPYKYLQKVSETLIGCKEADEEKSIERGLLFTKIIDFIKCCCDISITDENTGEVKAIGVDMSDGVNLIYPLLADYIEVHVNHEEIFKLHAQSPVLTVLRDLFKEISCED